MATREMDYENFLWAIFSTHRLILAITKAFLGVLVNSQNFADQIEICAFANHYTVLHHRCLQAQPKHLKSLLLMNCYYPTMW